MDEAVQAYKKSLSYNEFSLGVMVNLAKAVKDNDEKDKLLKKVLSIDNKNADAYFYLGFITQDVKKKEDYYRISLKYDEKNAQVNYFLATLLTDPQEKIERFDNAIKYGKGLYNTANYYLGKIFEEMGNTVDAIDSYGSYLNGEKPGVNTNTVEWVKRRIEFLKAKK
jgi:Tfp pilus assembly protein PilF